MTILRYFGVRYFGFVFRYCNVTKQPTVCDYNSLGTVRFMTNVTCGLTSKKRVSALCPTLVIKYRTCNRVEDYFNFRSLLISAISITFNYILYVSSQHPRLCTSSMLHQAWMKTLFVRLVTCIIVTEVKIILLFVQCFKRKMSLYEFTKFCKF